MAKLTDRQIAGYAQGAGFTGNGLTLAIAVALAESGGVTSATNQNKNSNGQVTSTDRGLWQINNYYHSEVSDTCAFDPSCAAQQAFRISNRGQSWQPWSTYNSGAYRQFMKRATSAVNAGPQTSIPPNNPSNTGTTALTVQSVANNYGLLPGTTDQSPPIQTLVFNGKLTGSRPTAIFGPLNTIIALGLLFGVLFALGKSRWGYVAIYYAEALIVFFLFVSQAQYIKQHLSVLTGIGSQNETTAHNSLSVQTLSAVGTPQQSGNTEFVGTPSPSAPPPPNIFTA